MLLSPSFLHPSPACAKSLADAEGDLWRVLASLGAARAQALAVGERGVAEYLANLESQLGTAFFAVRGLRFSANEGTHARPPRETHVEYVDAHEDEAPDSSPSHSPRNSLPFIRPFGARGGGR